MFIFQHCPLRVLPVDLHAHSSVSDGLLSPASLIRRAADNGVGVLALTDHDETGGVEAARAAATTSGIHFIPGVEISVTWRSKTLHIVGLGIDPRSATLKAGLASVRAGRRARAERMAEDLARAGIAGTLEGALGQARNPELISRTHFARHLVERGIVSEPREVFRRYLSEGKPGFVPHQWASLQDAVSWIRTSGGVAVIAHPGRYHLVGGRLAELLSEFRELGGTGIEVVTSSHRPDECVAWARLCKAFGLKGSVGSDFHGPGEQHLDVGRLPSLPAGVAPIWEEWACAVDGEVH